MNDKQTFIKGALILALANVISKILGAVFKIPLTYILKEEGMAMFNTASCIYSMFLALVISGIPLATSRLVSAGAALKKYADAAKTVRASRNILMLIGAAASLVLFFLAFPLSAAMKDPDAAYAVKIISPSVFFVAWGTAYKSYFQGIGKMTPTALSQVFEAIIRLLIGYFMAVLFINSADGVTAAAAVSGVTAGEILATLFLGAAYFFQSRKVKEHSTLRCRKIYSSIMAVAVPMLICSVTLSLLNLADMATVRNTLLKIRFSPESAKQFLLLYSGYTTVFDDLPEVLRLSPEGARWLYGAYSGYALTVFHLPVGMISTLCVSILPLIAGNLAKNNMAAMRSACRNALSLTLFCSVPFFVLFAACSGEMLFLLFRNTASAHMLSLVSPCLIFLCVSQLFTSVFHASGKVYEPFVIQLFGVLIKLLGNIILIKIPMLNMDGAIISSVISFFLIMVLLGRRLHKVFGISFGARPVFAPLVSAVPMYLVLKLTCTPLAGIFHNRYAALFSAAFVSGVAYLLCFSFFSPDGILSFFKTAPSKNKNNFFKNGEEYT